MLAVGKEQAGQAPGLPREARHPRLPRRFFRWLAGSEAIEHARQQVSNLSSEQREVLSRARAAALVAQRLLDGIDPPRYASATAMALGLYREAGYFALLSLAAQSGRPTPDALWESGSETLHQLALGTDQLDRVRRVFVGEKSFIEYSDMPAADAASLAALMRDFAERLIALRDRPVLKLQRLRILGVLRAGSLLSLIGVLAIGLTWFLLRAPDLAKGKPWRTSSTLFSCDPVAASCGGVKTWILFHTQEENDPWFEIDLGAPTRFSSMTMRNRGEYGRERAVPLIVEVSDDQKNFREVIRQTETFRLWKPRFSPQQARFVRLRAARKTFLHLESVQIHP